MLDNTIKIIDDWVYSAAGSGLFVDRLTDYHAYEDVGYWQVPDELKSSSPISRNWKRLHLVRDHFYTLIGRSLMVFSPEQIKGGRP